MAVVLVLIAVVLATHSTEPADNEVELSFGQFYRQGPASFSFTNCSNEGIYYLLPPQIEIDRGNGWEPRLSVNRNKRMYFPAHVRTGIYVTPPQTPYRWRIVVTYYSHRGLRAKWEQLLRKLGKKTKWDGDQRQVISAPVNTPHA